MDIYFAYLLYPITPANKGVKFDISTYEANFDHCTKMRVDVVDNIVKLRAKINSSKARFVFYTRDTKSWCITMRSEYVSSTVEYDPKDQKYYFEETLAFKGTQNVQYLARIGDLLGKLIEISDAIPQPISSDDKRNDKLSDKLSETHI
jgi:hypothetical protein